MKNQHLSKHWVVYDAKTDEVLANGTAKECAETLGISVDNFYQKNADYKRGKIKKWVFVEVEE